MNSATRIRFLTILISLGVSNSLAIAEPDPAKLYAWYRTDGLTTSGADVARWQNSATSGIPENRDLPRVFGRPRAFRVRTADGERPVMRLDGNSALWQAANDWGSLGQGRTVIVLLRVAKDADGFLFDGSTNSGLSRAQIRSGEWQAGVQPPPISNAANADTVTLPAAFETWQVQSFSLQKSEAGTRVTHLEMNEEEFRSAETTSFALSPLSGFIVGANAATKSGLRCDVAEILVFDRALSATEQQEVMTDLRHRWRDITDLPPEKQPKSFDDDPAVFRKIIRQPGDDGSKAYRIPGLAATPKGTLLAVFDIRHDGGGDLPGNIDVGLMRSTDDGESWSPMRPVLDFSKSEPDSHGNGVGDPAILVDSQTGTAFVVALWSKGNRAWNGSGPGLTPDETGQFVMTRSSDDGLTWTAPINLTSRIKGRDPKWRLLFNGPGSGIQLRNGTLVFAAQFREANGTAHSCFLFSRDHGESWTLSPPAIPGQPPTSESQIAELEDGSLLLSMRDESRSGERAWARWTWKPTGDALTPGQWSEPWHVVPDPTCMASLIRHPHGELLFSNPNSRKQRVALTVRISNDGGQSWSDGRLLDPRGCMYSSMAILNDGRIGILYEVAGTLTFARFPLEWVKQSHDH